MGHAQAATADGALRVEVITAYNFIVDSNVESPSTYAPRSAYISARIWNDGTTPITDVYAYIGNKENGGTPGIYPRRSHLSLVGPLPGNEFAFTHEGGTMGTSDATRLLGTIQPGSYLPVYWLVSYPNLDETGKSVTGGIKPDDDLFLFYDIWATGNEGATPRAVDVRRRATMRNCISAMANKIFPNTANKVPQEYQDVLERYAPEWNNIASDGTPGTRIVTEGIWYDLGNVGKGFDNDGNLVPDQNAWLQPVGDPTLFDPSSFRLVKTYALIVVKLKDGGEAVYDVSDQLYFTNLPDNTGVIGLVRYDYLSLKPNATSATTPYQMAASGFDNEKFNGDYGTSFTLTSPPSPLTLEKLVDKSSANPAETLAYTINYANPATLPVGDPSLGMALVINETIPPGTTYVAGSAATTNTLPAGVAAYDILYSTDDGETWQNTEPSPASAVTNIQWWLSDVMSGGTSGTVTFSVTVDSPFTNSPPRVLNTAGLAFGNATPFLTDDAITNITGNNSISGNVFVDNGAGTGGVFGDGAKNGTEAPIPAVRITLYYDADTDGVVSSGDTIWATMDSTDPNGTYSFPNLPDGRYIVVVDPQDADMPEGHVPTAAVLIATALDPFGTNPSAVNATNLDFGFAPILTLEKNGPATAYEGDLVTYNIALANNFVGDGTGGINVDTDYWASASAGDRRWLTQANASDAPTTGPNGTYSTVDFSGQPTDQLTLSGYSTAGTGTILGVEMQVRYLRTGNFRTGDTITFNLLYQGNVIHTSGAIVANTFTAGTPGTYTFDASSLRTWTHSDLANVTVRIDASKGGGSSQGGTFGIDQGGLRLTTQGVLFSNSLESETLLPVPLFDNYDPTRLEFVSASPGQTTVNTETGEIYWANVGPLFAGGTNNVTVTFRALEPPGNVSSNTTNFATSTGATTLEGNQVNDADDSAVTTILPTGTIGGRLWRDVDPQNGIQNPSETGIAGVTVTISGPNGYTATTTTDLDGNYIFLGLRETGTYTVTVNNATLPGGTGAVVYNQYGANNSNVGTITTMVVNSTTGADKVLDADFGYSGLQSLISGSVWEDVNRNAATTPDTGEPGLSGITVRLFDVSNNLVATTTTNASGYYQFLGNFSGTYSVRIDTSTGPLGPSWTQTYDSDGLGTAHRSAVTVPTGGSGTADFSYINGGALSIGDTIFLDWNGDGIQDTNEEGISHVTVLLFRDQDGNGLYNPLLDPLVAEVQTDINGNYLFPGLPAGRYFVKIDTSDPQLPSSYIITADPYEFKDGFSRVTLTTASNLVQDFGFQPTGTGEINGVVWRDRNGDQVQAGSLETGISGVLVTLQVDSNGNGIYVTLETAITGSNGTYSFTNLPDGNYRVVVSPTDEALPEDAFGNTWFATTPVSADISITSGTASDTGDFGFNGLSALGGNIFFDINTNGGRELNEPGIEGSTVLLYQNNTLVDAMMADADGNYLFTGLLPGTYTVVVDTSAAPLLGSTLSADPDNDGEPCVVLPVPVPCDNQVTRTLGSSQTLTGLDFGYILPGGTISGILWNDFNDNNLVDEEESRFQYILVELLDSNNTVIATTFTDENGFYSFGGLADGTYRVRVDGDDEIPAIFAQTVDPDGVLDNQTVVTIANANSATADFGYQASGTNSLSGTVGLETTETPTGLLNGTNPSGINAGAGEAPFAGVTVYIYTWNDPNTNNTIDSGELLLLGSTVTDANGDYSFTNLPASDHYVVSIAAPMNNLVLTTTASTTGHPAGQVVVSSNSQGHTTGAYQTVTAAASIDNMDFAFISVVEYDFGDLPESYSTLLPNGARHIVKPVPDLYLGQTVTTEPNGQPSIHADADSGDDGVLVTGNWVDGPNKGSVSVDVVGSGWLVGFIDFENNGTFTDVGNMVVSQAVTTGTYNFTFDIPAGSLDEFGTTLLYARFRILPTQPFIPELQFTGEAANGEVEDYRWAFHAVSGYVRVDADGDLSFSVGDSPQPGVIVRMFDDGNNLLATTVTDYDGFYHFCGFPPGNYEVRMETPTGSTAILDVDGGDFTIISIVLDDVSLTNQNFLLDGDTAPPTVAPLSGTVFVDSDRDNDFSAGDTPHEAVTIRLYRDVDNDGIPDSFEFITETETNSTGDYTFPDLPNGNYLIVMEPSAGVTPFLDVDGPLNGNDLIAATLSGSNIADQDFLARFNSSIAGTITINPHDDNLANLPHVGVTVDLLDDQNNVLLTTTTDSNGNYEFLDLPPGTYSVRQTVPANYTAVNDVDGGNLTIIGDVSLIVLGLDQDLIDQDFVNRADHADVAGRVWFDRNLNGLRAGTEPDVSGVTVRLLDSDLVVIATTTTGPNGNYLFDGLEPGEYTVEFVAPSGTAFTQQNADSAGLIGQENSDANLITGRTDSFTVGFNESRTGVDAGLISADLAVVKTASVQAANVGDTITYNIVVTNFGPTDSTGVLLTELYPLGINVTGTAVTQGTYTGNQWSLGRLNVGESATLTVTAEILSAPVGAGLTNTAVVTSTDVPDPNHFNNTSSAAVQISGLTIQKTSDQSTFVPLGGTITYTVVVENIGSVVQAGLTLQDLMPQGVNYVPNSVQAVMTNPSPLPTGSQTFDISGLSSFTVPDGVTSLQVEAWGGGASGAASGVNDGGGAGGGGAYARLNTVNVTPGQQFQLFVAQGGALPGAGNPGLDGGNSWFGNQDTLFAEGGLGGTVPTGGLGGQAASSIGDVVFSGGNGGNGSTTGNPRGGGGGGGSAYFNANGGNGGNGSGGTPGIGGLGTGNGGSGGVSTTQAQPGFAPGGGGGGCSGAGAGTGANGRVVVSYTYTGIEGTAAAPPSLASGWSLIPGATLTVTFQATVDAPVSADLTNVAFVTTNFVQAPLYAEVTDPLAVGSISGTIRIDETGNKNGDAPQPSVAVTLLDNANNVIATTTTDTNGNYTFSLLPPGTYRVVQTVPSGFNAVNDFDGGNYTINGDVNALVIAAGTDITGQDFVNQEAVSIFGTVRADTTGNGIGNLTLGGVTLTLLDEVGNVVLTTVSASNGTYSFTNLLAGTYQVAQTQPVGYGSLSDKDGGNPNLIGDVQMIVLPPGEESTGNDFLEFLQSCPDQWDDWTDKWDVTLNGEIAFTDNPDGDRYSNLIEYAFCLPPNSGVMKPFCLFSSTSVAGAVDGLYRRTAIGGAKDVTYTLEWTAALGNPTTWTGSVELDGTNTTVTNNGDGTEVVRITDLETLTGLTNGSGFVRIRVDLDNGLDQATDTTEVLGWVQTEFELCCTTYNNPFLECAVFTGTVDAVDGQNLDFTESAGPFDLGSLLQPGVAYYLEVETGDFAGHRFDVVSGQNSILTIANDSDLGSASLPYNTVQGAAPALLAGDRVALHRHRTLGGMFPPSSFGASGAQSSADEVQLFAGNSWEIYWLYNGNNPTRWVDAGVAGLADMGSRVIPPGQGMFFQNRTQATSILSFGEVREHGFASPVVAGANLVAGGYPIDQSAAGTGGRELKLEKGFFGSRDFKTADSFYVWRPDSNPAATNYDTYYLANGGAAQPSFRRWIKVGDAGVTPRDSEQLLKRDRSVFLRAKEARPNHWIPAPWSP